MKQVIKFFIVVILTRISPPYVENSRNYSILSVSDKFKKKTVVAMETGLKPHVVGNIFYHNIQFPKEETHTFQKRYHSLCSTLVRDTY